MAVAVRRARRLAVHAGPGRGPLADPRLRLVGGELRALTGGKVLTGYPACPAAETDLFVATKHRIYTISFASVYPHYLAKAEKKGRSKAEVDEIIRWLTGYEPGRGSTPIWRARPTLETFFAEAPGPNPARAEIKGLICGIRVEEIEDPLMREIRYLDKLIDELAKGKAMEKILRK